MKLHFYPVTMPCEFEFKISRSAQTAAQNVMVALTYETGGKSYTGLGEAVPTAFYHHTQDSILWFLEQPCVHDCLKQLTPFDVTRFNALFTRMDAPKPAQAAIEMALYDLMGKIYGQPLYRMWGLDTSEIPRSSYTIGLADLETVRHKTRIALDRGYDILKVKVGGPADLETLEAIRCIVPDTTTLRVDANAAWKADDAIALMPKLVDLGVEFVEEPLRLDCAITDRLALKEHSPLPIIADESVHTLRDIAGVATWADGINLKLTKTGGLMEAHRMISAARALGLSVMLGCFAESSLSITAFAHLAPLVDYLDLDGGLLLADDPMCGIRWEGNRLFLPERPGLGVVPS